MICTDEQQQKNEKQNKISQAVALEMQEKWERLHKQNVFL